MISALVPKLRNRFSDSAAQCGASAEVQSACKGVDSAVLEEILEESRIFYGQYNPITRVVPFRLDAGVYTVVLDTEPLAVEGVYVNQRAHAMLPVSNHLANLYADPEYSSAAHPGRFSAAQSRLDAMYEDYNTPEVGWQKIGNTLRLLPPLEWPLVGEVHIAAIREWDEIPIWAQTPIIKLSLVALVDRFTSNAGGLLRIPTPNGYFEFDGGRVMQNMRSKLETEAMRGLEVGMSGLGQG